MKFTKDNFVILYPMDQEYTKTNKYSSQENGGRVCQLGGPSSSNTISNPSKLITLNSIEILNSKLGRLKSTQDRNPSMRVVFLKQTHSISLKGTELCILKMGEGTRENGKREKWKEKGNTIGEIKFINTLDSIRTVRRMVSVSII